MWAHHCCRVVAPMGLARPARSALRISITTSSAMPLPMCTIMIGRIRMSACSTSRWRSSPASTSEHIRATLSQCKAIWARE